MKKTLRVLLLLTLLFQYTIPITTMAQENSTSYSSSSNSEEVSNEHEEKQTTETSSSEEKTQQTTDEINKNQTETNNQENSNAPPILNESEEINQSETNVSQGNGNLDENNQQNYEKISPLQRAASDAPILLPDGVGVISIDKDNFLDYFKLNGSASYNQTTGILTLTPDQNSKAGNATFKKKILFNQDFTMDLEANIGNKSASQGGADGIGIGFHSGNVDSIGSPGNGFGVKGLPGVLGYKIDTYKNGNDGDDIAGFGGNDTFVAFMGRDGYKTINDVNKYGEQSRPKKVSNPVNNQFKPLQLNYNTGTGLYTGQYDGTTMSINPNTYYGATDFSRSLIMSAATGALRNLQQIKINKITLSVPVAIIEKVDADNTDIKLQGATFDIYNSNNTKVATDLTTDANGYIYLPVELESGNYYAIETVAPNGYDINKDKVPFVIDNNKSTSYIAASIKNRPKPGKLQTSKEVNKEVVRKGDTVTYTLNVNNIGGSDTVLNNVKVEDAIPDGISLDPNSIKIDGSPTQNESQDNNKLLLTLSKISGGQGKKVTFDAIVTKNPEGTVKNIATITDPNNPNDPQNPEVPFKVVPSAGKLATEKTVYDKDGNSVGNQKVKVGDIIEYRINAKNTEGAETIVNNVKVSDEIPAGLSYQAGSLKVTMPDGSTKTLSDEQVNGQTLATGDLGSLKGGEGVTVSFKVKVTEKATGTVTNVATVDGNVPPTIPGQPDIPLTPGKPRVVTNISRKKETTPPLSVPPRGRENLPNTGEKLSYILPVSGVIIVLFVAGYRIKRRK